MTAEGSPEREGSEDSPGAENAAEDAAESGANGSQTGDTRLRDAVAAWVAGSDDLAGDGDSEPQGEAEGKASREADVEGDGDVEDDGDAEVSDAAPSTDTVDETGPADTDPAGADAADGSRTDSEADAVDETGSGSEPEDAEPEDAVAAAPDGDDVAADGTAKTDAEGASDAVADTKADTKDDQPAGGRGTGADEPKTDAAHASEGSAASEADDGAAPATATQDADAEPASSAAADGASESTDAKDDGPAGSSDAEDTKDAEDADRPEAESAGDADPTSSTSESSTSDAEPSDEGTPAGGRGTGADESTADAAPDPGDEAAPASAGSAASGADSEAASAATAQDTDAAPASGTDTDSDSNSGSAADRDVDAKLDPRTDPRADGGAAPAADRDDAAAKPGSGETADTETESEGEGEPKRPVDQPTAAFKVRSPAVDQPTTMLKVGDAKPDGKEPEEKEDDKPSTAKPAPERDSERTSKFVALKPLDEPARPTEKPAVPPAAETAAIPQVGPERTAQQPLPPKPPLDLLAELTNTPPPPETPVRTIVRRVKIWTPLVLLLAVVFAVVQAVRPLPTPALALTADETYAFEGDKVSLPWPGEGQGWMDVNGIGTVDNFGEQQPVAIGSVAKAMVAYVILKDHPLKPGDEGKNIPVDAKAETEGGYDKDGESTLNTIKDGDTLTQRQALAAIMIPSANNVARLLARWDANGSEEAFVKKMNDAAADLGMKNTKYTDPSGLKETTVSTAEDQVKLGNELVQMKALTDITKLPTWKDPSGRVWQNYNRLVPYDNAIGIKTGSTTKAGGNLLFAATEDVGGETVTVVGAILGQHKPPIIDTVNAVSKTAMIAAQDALISSKILKKGDVVGYVDDGLGGRTPVVVTQDVSAVGWAGKTVKLNLSDDGTAIPHEAKAGTKVGSLSVGDGTGDAVEVPVALESDLTEPGYGSKLTRVS